MILTILKEFENLLSKNILYGLNSLQKQAVTYPKLPLLIIAGAGSGKTKVITRRIAYFISNGLNPKFILAITFSNKSANEMKYRINSLIGPELANKMQISTFHSFCLKILREKHDLINLSNNFSIYNRYDSLKLIEDIIKKEIKHNIKKINPKTIMNKISSLKCNLIEPHKYEQIINNNNQLTSFISYIYYKYTKYLSKFNALDFDDLILKTAFFFQKQASDFYKSRYKAILIDEYQDTNFAQYYLIKKMIERKEKQSFNANITIVGDSDQSIYGFRGANSENISYFLKDNSKSEIIYLEQNYRSTQNILDASNALIAKNSIIDNKKIKKKLWTKKEIGEKIKVVLLSDEAQEICFIVKEINRLLKNNIVRSFNHFAILYRMNSQSRIVEEYLTKSRIPHIILGSTYFYEREEIKDMIAYMKILSNFRDCISLKRIINKPNRGMGKNTAALILNRMQENHCDIFDALKYVKNLNKTSKRVIKVINNFNELMKNLENISKQSQSKNLLESILRQTNYIDFLKSHKSTLSNYDSKFNNLQELLHVANEYDTKYPNNNFNSFLENILLSSENYKSKLYVNEKTQDSRQGNHTIQSKEKTQIRGYVSLMTLHAAKGLEFSNVFIIGMEDGILPYKNALFDINELSEERRLAYVGYTRAMERLYLTRVKNRNYLGKLTKYSQSRFIKEIPKYLKTQYVDYNI